MSTRFIEDHSIGNFFSERQFLVSTSRCGDNYYKKVLVPFAEYIIGNDDTSDYKEVNSKLSKLLNEYFNPQKTQQECNEVFWKNASSIPRILPIIYFEKIENKNYLRLTELAKAHFQGEISSKEFLLLWVLRFQGSEFSHNNILTVSDKTILSSSNGRYRDIIENRIVKPGVLALQILKCVKDRGEEFISDKQFRHARKLKDQRESDAINELVDIIMSGEFNDTSQENQIFNVLSYLGLCEIKAFETNNYKYKITGLGIEIVNFIEKNAFRYCYNNVSTEQFVKYFGGMPNTFERKVIDTYIYYGGTL